MFCLFEIQSCVYRPTTNADLARFHRHHELSDVTCCTLTDSVVTSRGVPRILHLAFHPTRSWHIESIFSMALMSRRFMCLSLLVRYCWIVVIHVIGGSDRLPLHSVKNCLAGVSGFKSIRWPSHDSRRRSVTTLQGSHFVTSYRCWFVMTRGYFIPRAYRSCR